MYFPCVATPACFVVASQEAPKKVLFTIASQEAPRKVLFATKIQPVITRPQTSTAITFSTNVFSMKIENQHVP
jgi:hypothetical protein